MIQKHVLGLTILIAGVVSGAVSGLAFAQDSALTPRERVIISLQTDRVGFAPDAAIPGAAISESLVPAAIAVEPSDIESAIKNVEASSDIAELETPVDTSPPPIFDIPLPSTGMIFEPAEGRYGFFQTAPDYLAARGTAAGSQLKLRYKVVKSDGVTGISSPPEMVNILLGTDYAATSRGDGPMKIFDFKTRRLLTLTADAPEHFTNVSLYAARYKNIDTVRRMTNGGKLRDLTAPKRGAIPLSASAKPKGLNAFYLESSLGWAAAPLPKRNDGEPALTMKTKDRVTEARFDGKNVFTAKFNGPDFDVSTQGYSLISLFYHMLPIHPEILANLTTVTTAPTYLKLYIESPNAPSGQIESWTLTDAVADEAPFPLPSGALSVTELEAVSPLAFVMTEALHGRALGGPPDITATLAAMENRLEAGDVLAVWLSANAMSDRMGNCEALDGLCAMIARARTAGMEDEDLRDLFTAFDDVNTPAKRIGALMTLQEAVADPDAPGIVLRTTALGLAKLKRTQIVTAGLSDLKPEILLTQAIAKDPYDYAAYQGLAQVYAARGAFIESWDMSDALRAFPDVPDAMTTPFERAEQTLSRGAPGFFPPLQP